MLLNELLEQENCSVEYPSPIGIVNIPKERNIYNVIRKKYYHLAKEAVEHFSSLYDSYNSCNDILHKTSVDFQKSICIGIDEIKKDLISVERYDWDYDTIYQYANEGGYLEDFFTAYDSVCEQILSIIEDLEAQKQFRQERKDNRARWEGGSIGGTVIDNYAHQASIGMRNIAEGIGHSLWNAGANAFSQKSADSKMKRIFSDSKTRKTIENGVFEAAFTLHHVLIRLFFDFNQEIVWGVPSESDMTTAQRLLNNVKSGAVPKDKENQLYQQILALNPYNLELFENMLFVFGDKSGELGALADYYNIDLQTSKDYQALEYVQEIQGETEEESVKAKEKLLDYCAGLSLPISEDLECIKYINKRLEDFDLQYRTVDGIVFDTREEADSAKEELAEIKEFMSHISAPTADSLLDYEQALKNSIAEFDIKFSSRLKDKYIKLMEKYLKDFDDQFCTVGLFKKLDRKSAGQERLLKLIKKYDVSSPDKIAEAYAGLKELLPKVGLEESECGATLDYLEKCKDDLALKFIKENIGTTEDDAKEAKEKLISFCGTINLNADGNCKCIQFIDKILADFDLKYRTVDGIACQTREGADLARSEFESIRTFMGQISEPTSESLLDYETDLLEKRKSFEETFQSELKQKYLGQIDKYLSDFDKKFCSIGLFKKGDRKQAGKDKALKYVKKLDCSSPDKVTEAYRLLEEFLPKVGLTLEEASEARQYLDKKKNSKGILGKRFKK